MPVPPFKPAYRFLLLLFCLAFAAGLNFLGWWWPSRPAQVGYVATPAQQTEPVLIESVSFAPFRRGQSPLTRVYPKPEQVAEDLASLKGVTAGIRTYTAREGLEGVPAEAQRLGLSVMQGLWLGRDAAINEAEVAAAIDLANRYPDAIKSVIVGNEVLLRKDLSVDQLIGHIRRVKAAIKQPVTYADVWEFWLCFPQLLQEVDFVTVHFLPYWEDRPVGVAHAMPHILDVYNQVKAALPGKPIVIGEVGWPSAGRSRRDAVPSRIEAAGFIADFLQIAQREKLSYNLVEAFDQPWKTRLEGTVGGAWGVLDELRRPKFDIGGKVSDLPEWPLFSGLALLLALILNVVQAQRLAALPPRAMLAAVLFSQALGAMLAAAIEHGLEHNFTPMLQTEFFTMTVLQGLFAVLLFNDLLDRFSGGIVAPPLRGLGDNPSEIRRLRATLWLRGLAAGQLSLRRTRLIEGLYGVFALLMVYQGVMLCIAGRYRDFPIDFFLLPVAGLMALRLLTGGHGPLDLRRYALATGSVQLQHQGGQRFGWETVLAFLLLCLPVLVLLIEKADNREAVFWCLLTAAYAVPLLGSLLTVRAMAGHKGIAEPAPSR